MLRSENRCSFVTLSFNYKVPERLSGWSNVHLVDKTVVALLEGLLLLYNVSVYTTLTLLLYYKIKKLQMYKS